MAECICSIIQIDFNLFWKISFIVVVPSLISLFYKDLPPRFEEYKKHIKSSVGSDPETGIPHLPSRRKENLLKYNLPTRLIWLLMCPFASLIFVIIYFICDKIPRLSNSIWYNCVVSVFTIMGILPVILALWLTFSILIKLVRLYSESSTSVD
jgi:hypothetical protein